MNRELSLRSIDPDKLVAEARGFRKSGYRLIQISATRELDRVELTYSFDKDTQVEHLRVNLPVVSAQVPSITSVYWCAFLYENELHDLFNVQVDGLALDFHGNLYKTAIKFPFGSTKPPVKPATATDASRPATPIASKAETNRLN